MINSPRGCNMAVRREPFVKIGGFNNDFKGNAWGFEADFGLRVAREKGGYGKYVGNAIVIHHEAPSGGSRNSKKDKWFSDFLYNHKLLINNIGLQAWIGSIPRLIKDILSVKDGWPLSMTGL
jgi:GT2 family glycosyltransferase